MHTCSRQLKKHSCCDLKCPTGGGLLQLGIITFCEAGTHTGGRETFKVSLSHTQKPFCVRTRSVSLSHSPLKRELPIVHWTKYSHIHPTLVGCSNDTLLQRATYAHPLSLSHGRCQQPQDITYSVFLAPWNQQTCEHWSHHNWYHLH